MRGKRIEDKVDRIATHLERVDAAIVVRDPSTPYAAEAYEGLRKQVQHASQQQRLYLSTLINLLDDIAAGATVNTLNLRMRDRLNESGVRELSDPDQMPEAFTEVESTVPTRSAWVLVFTDGSAVVIRPGTRHARAATSSSDDRGIPSDEIGPDVDPASGMDETPEGVESTAEEKS